MSGFFSPCKIPGTLHQRREKKASNCPAQTSRQGPLALCLSVAPSKAIFMSRLNSPWHSAFRIWQRIKGLSRLSRTWTMALCLSVAPSKAIFMSRLNSTRTWNGPGLFGSGKGMHKRVRIKVPVHSLVHLFAGVGEVTQKSVVFSWDRAH